MYLASLTTAAVSSSLMLGACASAPNQQDVVPAPAPASEVVSALEITQSFRIDPGEAIRASSVDFEEVYERQIVSADRRAQRLGRSLKWQRRITKFGQYVGGGGAIGFGLDEKGKNAALSGLVASTFTLIENLNPNDEMIAEREACKQISMRFNEVRDAARLWRASANNQTFQARFPTVLDSVQTAVSQTVNNSTCDYELPRWQNPLEAIANVRTRYGIDY